MGVGISGDCTAAVANHKHACLVPDLQTPASFHISFVAGDRDGQQNEDPQCECRCPMNLDRHRPGLETWSLVFLGLAGIAWTIRVRRLGLTREELLRPDTK